jgi:hypothetical protein
MVGEEDIAMFGFILGALVGAVSAWYWGDRIREFADSNMSGARKSAAGALRSLAEKTERMPGRTTERVGSATPPAQGGAGAFNG